MSASAIQFLKYYSELKEDQRYEEKLKTCKCLKDPYCYLESRAGWYTNFKNSMVFYKISRYLASTNEHLHISVICLK